MIPPTITVLIQKTGSRLFAELQRRILDNQQTGSAQSGCGIALEFLEFYSADELVDDLIIRCGMESAVEIALLALQLRYKPVKGAVTTIIPPNHEAESLPSWHQRLCHHLSLASEDEWQRCVDKVLGGYYDAIPSTATFCGVTAPLNARILPMLWLYAMQIKTFRR